MRLVIDLQGAQAGHAQRGIGRYSLALAQAIAKRARGHEILLALNGAWPASVESMGHAFEGLLPASALRVWHSPLVSGSWPSLGLQRAAERTREAFLAQLAPDAVLVTSLFEGPTDGAVTSCGEFARLPTAVVLYDLIPLLRPDPYLKDPLQHAHYRRKLQQLQRADLWLAISEASRQEALHQLGPPAHGCVNVSSAADARFAPATLADEARAALLTRLGLQQPFVLYTGGIDPRKNVEGLVSAFAALPPALRQTHQLAVVCAVQPESRQALQALAQACGLAPGQMVLTGYVPDAELVALYSLCQAFVFPSLHEGFGLPVLEAMACGAPVIAANCSSLPEVVGRADALFNPYDTGDISARLQQVLTDPPWRAALAAHGLARAQAFSWEATADRALDALEQLVVASSVEPPTAFSSTPVVAQPARNLRPRLAYVSPLPPQRSGIADYSALLLPALAAAYDIDVVVDDPVVADPATGDAWVRGCCAMRSPQWLIDHAAEYDHVLYHFGNSAFHSYMFELLARVPGVVVLHDFYLSGVLAHQETQALRANAWSRELFWAHGYPALARRQRETDLRGVVYDYPCSFSVTRQATGVIVHSTHALELARQWYGPQAADGWVEIPLARKPAAAGQRAAARRRLGLTADAFVVCSFGLLGPTKHNQRLLRAWSQTRLARQAASQLVFVGENHPSDYGRQLQQAVADGAQGRVSITGWASEEMFRDYLDAADLAVQLRSLSRGETSAAVLDCMNHGLATIVNANGAMAALPPDAVCLLPDEFEDDALAAAIDALAQDAAARTRLGESGRAVVQAQHTPQQCAARYVQALEHFARHGHHSRSALTACIAGQDDLTLPERRAVAQAIQRSLPTSPAARQLLVDVSELVQRDAGSGIQRVVKRVLSGLLHQAPPGWQVRPVYAQDGQPGYRHACGFTLAQLGCKPTAWADEPVDLHPGDLFLGLDLQPHLVPHQQDFFDRLRAAGGQSCFVVYDLLPILLPQHFVPGAAQGHAEWLRAAARADGLVCISQAVANELLAWLQATRPSRPAGDLKVGWFHLGADLPVAATQNDSAGLHAAPLPIATQTPTLLMVGTVEPRKGHALVLDALERLWAAGESVQLVVVGKPGWMVNELTQRLRQHPQAGRQLQWLEQASDEQLMQCYGSATALVAASEGEGFGLPLIEAAAHGLPVIARDLPVFREVAGEQAWYFPRHADAPVLAESLRQWLQLWHCDQHPPARTQPGLRWDDSVQQLLDVVVAGRWQTHWHARP